MKGMSTFESSDHLRVHLAYIYATGDGSHTYNAVDTARSAVRLLVKDITLMQRANDYRHPELADGAGPDRTFSSMRTS